MSQFDEDEANGNAPWDRHVPRRHIVDLSDSYYANHGKPWSIEDNQTLMHGFAFGNTLNVTSLSLKRKPSAVTTQCARMLVKFMNAQGMQELAYLTDLRRQRIDSAWLAEVRDHMNYNNSAAALKLDRILGGGAITTKSKVNSPKLSEKYVNYNHLITLLQKGYTTVEVSFHEPKTGEVPTVYTYKMPDKLKDLGCDRVVVENDRGVMVVAWIFLTHETPQIDVAAPYAYKWIVDVVREQDYIEQGEREKQAIKMMQDGERARAQAEALETLMASVPNREELMKLLGN